MIGGAIFFSVGLSVPVSTAPLISRIQNQDSFSFRYDGKASRSFIGSWKKTSTKTRQEKDRHTETTEWTDPATGLVVSREVVRFHSFPAIEILLRLQNIGSHDTPLLEDIRPLDFTFTPPGEKPVVLHHVRGSAIRSRQLGDAIGMHGMQSDYSPLQNVMESNSKVTLAHYVMKKDEHEAVESDLPFFNLQWQTGGLIGGIGWTGQWWIHAERGSSRSVTFQAAQQTTRLILHPGESIRTPRVLLADWTGPERMAGHNLFRRLLTQYYLPRIDGNIQMPPISHISAYTLIFDDIATKTGKNPLEILPTLRQRDLGQVYADPGAALNWVTAQNQLELIRNLPEIGLEAYWLDAGWFEGLWPGGRGSWFPKEQFPDGLKPLSLAAHARGLKFLVWFDPEGVARNSRIDREHPEWTLHHPKEGNWGGLFRWENPDARRYMTDLIAERISDWGIDILRNDRNTCPVQYWRLADTPNRQGITEIRQIEGLYAFWDSLLKRFPKLTIDNANWRVTGPDLEVMKRTLGSLTRSELTTGGLPSALYDQVQSMELSRWVPLHSTLLQAVDPYNVRSTSTSGVGIGLNLSSPYIPREQLKKALNEIRDLRPYWLGDYYSLTDSSANETDWCGWQFHRSDLSSGFATVFRRPQCQERQLTLGLKGLDAKSTYEVSFAETFDVQRRVMMSGDALQGLQVEIPSTPTALLIRYRRVDSKNAAHP